MNQFAVAACLLAVPALSMGESRGDRWLSPQDEEKAAVIVRVAEKTCMSYNLYASGCEKELEAERERARQQAKREGLTFEQAWDARNHGHYGYNYALGVGNQIGWDPSGKSYGPPADKDCPLSPYFDAVREDERPAPMPEMGCHPGQACGGGVVVYFGTSVSIQGGNTATCQWDAETGNKRIHMLNRCWPKWNGQLNIVTTKYRCGRPWTPDSD